MKFLVMLIALIDIFAALVYATVIATTPIQVIFAAVTAVFCFLAGLWATKENTW